MLTELYEFKELVENSAQLRAAFRQTGDVDLLDESIKLQRSALNHPLSYMTHASVCGTLADSLEDYVDHMGNQLELDKAIALGWEVLDLRPTHDPKHVQACNNLARSFVKCYQQTGDDAVLEEALTLFRQALRLRPMGHPDRSASCVNLAASLLTRFNRTGDETLVDEAIALQREALELRPARHPDRPMSCFKLAVSLSIRSNLTGDEELLDEAITLDREALGLQPVGHPDRSMSCANLAVSLLTRFIRTGDEKLLDETIALHREALELRPVSDPTRSISCGNLAALLSTRFSRTGDESLLGEAIKLRKEVLDLHPVDHPDRSTPCLDLASLLDTQFHRTGDQKILEESKLLLTEALNCLSSEHPNRWRVLAFLALMHITPTNTATDPHTALSYAAQALESDADNIHSLLSLASRFLPLFDLRCTHVKFEEPLLGLYSAVIDLASLVASFLLDRDAQSQYLTDCGQLGLNAFSIARSIDKAEVGLQLLERARGVVWSQLLHLRDPDPLIQSVPSALAQELDCLLHKLSTYRSSVPGIRDGNASMMPGFLQDRDEQYIEHARIQRLLRDIRSHTGLEDFMRGPTLDTLMATAKAHPVVVLVANKDEFTALIIRSPHEPLEFVPLVQIQRLEANVNTSADSPSRSWELIVDRDVEDRYTSSQHPEQRSILAIIWEVVVKPVIVCLGLRKTTGRQRPRIHWCPIGAFSFLPLHAAGIYEDPNRQCCSDYAVSSYTPSLTALHSAQTQARVIDVPSSALLVVAAKNHELPPLPNAERETCQVIELAVTAGMTVDALCDDSAIQDHVASSLESAQLVHVASHASENPFQPLQSGLRLNDGILSVEQLMKLDLKNAFFAFLSACETYKGDRGQPDQTIHLAAALLFTGFKSVVATMWTMNESDGPVVAKLFYQKLLESETIDADSIPYALDHAVSMLRKSGASWQKWATFIHMGA